MEIKKSTLEELVVILNFYNNKKVFITGHSGFKGSWLCEILLLAGADVTGYSLEPTSNESLFNILNIKKNINSHFGDIRDLENLKKVFNSANPEIVIHLAAQPIVLESYKNPVYTYETNVIGTANILECVRLSDSVKSVLNVTTDKVYENKEWSWGYRENENLDGYDPYSNSKSCSELVSNSYKRSFFKDLAFSTARSGNVIGGGDFSSDRIIPDCFRAASKSNNIEIRNPFSIRPYQHVLDSLFAYLLIINKQYFDKSLSGAYNVGPDDSDCLTTGKLVELFCEYWGEDLSWINKHTGGPHEANFLKLDCSKIKNNLNWNPVLGNKKNL